MTTFASEMSSALEAPDTRTSSVPDRGWDATEGGIARPELFRA